MLPLRPIEDTEGAYKARWELNDMQTCIPVYITWKLGNLDSSNERLTWSHFRLDSTVLSCMSNIPIAIFLFRGHKGMICN